MNCLLTIWSSHPEYYFIIHSMIKTLNQKYEVNLVSQNKFSNSTIYFKNCKSHRIFKSKNFILDKFYFLFYIIYLTLFTIIKKPKFVIVYNHEPIFFTFFIRCFYKGLIIYHNFDYDPKPKNFFKKLLNFVERKLIKNFDLLIFSNKEREFYYKKINNIKNIKTLFMYNSLSINFEKSFVKKKKNKKFKVIFRIGSIGPGHGLINLVKSFKFLSANYKLVCCGVIHDFIYYKKLIKIIKNYKIKDKIKIYISPSESFWKKILFSADLGVAFYENVNFSHRYMVGASQKMNSYISANLPMITSQNENFRNFEKKFKCSKTVNIKSPIYIAEGIRHMLQKRNYIKKKNFAHLAYKNEFNFEKQFSKIKKFIY